MIKRHEGVCRRPYRCPAGLWTVGVGHLLYPGQARLKLPFRRDFALQPQDDRVFTDEEINALLRRDLSRFERGVGRLCPAARDHQHQFDALVSFSFNLGLGRLQRSTLRQRFNRGDVEAAGEEFLKFTMAAGKVLRGLLKRRQEERALFLGRLREIDDP